MHSPILPSPLCDKELEDLILRVGRRHTDNSETSHCAANDEVGDMPKISSQLPDWASFAILTNKVQYSVFHVQ